MVFVLPLNTGIYSIPKGVILKCSSRGFRASRGFQCEKRTTLPKQPPSGTPNCWCSLQRHPIVASDS